MADQKLPIEDIDSWKNQLERSAHRGAETEPDAQGEDLRRPSSRRLHHHHQHHADDDYTDDDAANADLLKIEAEQEARYWKHVKKDRHAAKKLRKQRMQRDKEALEVLWQDSGVRRHTVHGLMIDAGSTGSRLHVYEWEPRILATEADIQLAVAGEKLSYPGTDSRWTDRLQPGLSSFGNLPTSELEGAIADYLKPLLDFARTVLHSKVHAFGDFPIFLRATAGMRVLNPTERARVITVVRDLFANKTYCPFAFFDEQARVLSGEEESIFDWAGVNFLMGNLIESSAGTGTVVNPRLTQGSLDLGGGSTQIGFYEPNEDIMSNLFKLQIGQAKHWNVYAHSFLFYGMKEAIDRFQARLTSGKSSEERLVEGVYNPCMPGGSKVEMRTNIHLDKHGVESWNFTQKYPSGNGYYQAFLKNNNATADVDTCMELTKDLLHLEKNDWCDFAHGDCSFAGIYQPDLPNQHDDVFGGFIAFSNYYHVWKFLKLPEIATINQLENATRYVCSLNRDELVSFHDGVDDANANLDGQCFRATYVFQLLHNGFGFQMTDSIRAVKVVNGHKVGWALGAMLYEINTLPWSYLTPEDKLVAEKASLQIQWDALFLVAILFAMFACLLTMFIVRRQYNMTVNRHRYEEIEDVPIDSKP